MQTEERDATMCVSNRSPPSTTTSKLSTMTYWLSPDLGQCSLLVESIPDLEHFNVTAGLLHTLLLSFTRSRLLLICELNLAARTTMSAHFSKNRFLSAENAPDVVEMIQDLLSKHSKLNYDELLTVLNKLKDVVDLSEVTPTVGQALIDIISNILQSDSNLLPFTNT